MRGTKLTLTAAVMAMLGTGLAVSMGACSDPFSSDGYGGVDGGGGGGGTPDATTPPGTEAGAPGAEAGAPIEAGVAHPSVDGITDTTCIPKSCQGQNLECGDASDGCGRQLDCGVCQKYGYTCNAGACGCTPKTAAADCDGLCGAVPDGCGSFYNCAAPVSCGTGSYCGPTNTCQQGSCSETSDPQNACGTISDGCGSTKTAGGSCPTNNVNNGCNNGPDANRCGCFGSSCGQQGFACSIPGSKPVGDLCQDPGYQCSGCTYPPGTCTAEHQCVSCTRVAAPQFTWDTQCEETARPEAWACDCMDGGTCNAPDGVKATPPTCSHLVDTSAHAIYCCARAQE
jgi:hypothetical protein